MTETKTLSGSKPIGPTLLIVLALAIFALLFALIDTTYFKFADARFPNVGDSHELATLWGVVSRAYLIVLMIPLIVWRRHQFGFQLGQIRSHWRLLLIMLIANCGIIAGYLWLSNSSTPYSGNQWLITEVITVPIVEEAVWRGLVLTVLLLMFRKFYPEKTSSHLAVWLSGLAFGVLHANNIAAGVPAIFVAIQVLNATIWGVVYGYARTQTNSVYPSMFLHAAMNLVVVLF